MVSLVECGTQVDMRGDLEIRTCTSVAIQVEPGDFSPIKVNNNKYGNGVPLLSDTSPSTEIVVEEGSPPEYRCDYCYGCLYCEQGHAWYSIHGKSFLWVLLLTPGYIALGLVLLPFFILMGLAYCVAAAIE